LDQRQPPQEPGPRPGYSSTPYCATATPSLVRSGALGSSCGWRRTRYHVLGPDALMPPTSNRLGRPGEPTSTVPRSAAGDVAAPSVTADSVPSPSSRLLVDAGAAASEAARRGVAVCGPAQRPRGQGPGHAAGPERENAVGVVSFRLPFQEQNTGGGWLCCVVLVPLSSALNPNKL
jgi:hypothetical protein